MANIFGFMNFKGFLIEILDFATNHTIGLSQKLVHQLQQSLNAEDDIRENEVEMSLN